MLCQQVRCRATMRAGSAKLEAELTEIQRRIADAGTADVLADLPDIAEFVRVFKVSDERAAEFPLWQEFSELSLDRQRAIVRDAFDGIRIKSRGKGRVRPAPQHIESRLTRNWR